MTEEEREQAATALSRFVAEMLTDAKFMSFAESRGKPDHNNPASGVRSRVPTRSLQGASF